MKNILWLGVFVVVVVGLLLLLGGVPEGPLGGGGGDAFTAPTRASCWICGVIAGWAVAKALDYLQAHWGDASSNPMSTAVGGGGGDAW
jgi:hypothetical protein